MSLTDSFLTGATELHSGFHGPDLPDIRGDRQQAWISPSVTATSPNSSSPVAMSATDTGRGFTVSLAMPPGISTASPCSWQCWSLRSCSSATLLWAVDHTLCRKRGLTLYGAGHV